MIRALQRAPHLPNKRVTSGPGSQKMSFGGAPEATLSADISKDRPGRPPLYIMLNALIVIVADHHVLRPQRMEDKTSSDAGSRNS